MKKKKDNRGLLKLSTSCPYCHCDQMSLMLVLLDPSYSTLMTFVLLVSSNKVPPPHPPFSLSETHYHRNDTKPSRYNLSDKRDRIYIHYIPIFTLFYVTDSLGTTVELRCNCLCNRYYTYSLSLSRRYKHLYKFSFFLRYNK